MMFTALTKRIYGYPIVNNSNNLNDLTNLNNINNHMNN